MIKLNYFIVRIVFPIIDTIIQSDCIYKDYKNQLFCCLLYFSDKKTF